MALRLPLSPLTLLGSHFLFPWFGFLSLHLRNSSAEILCWSESFSNLIRLKSQRSGRVHNGASPLRPETLKSASQPVGLQPWEHCNGGGDCNPGDCPPASLTLLFWWFLLSSRREPCCSIVLFCFLIASFFCLLGSFSRRLPFLNGVQELIVCGSFGVKFWGVSCTKQSHSHLRD